MSTRCKDCKYPINEEDCEDCLQIACAEASIKKPHKEIMIIDRRSFKFFIAWYDFWVGGYWSESGQTLYICPFFCCVFAIRKRSESANDP